MLLFMACSWSWKSWSDGVLCNLGVFCGRRMGGERAASVSLEVLIKWKEVIIKFTAVPQSTTVCVLLITYTGPRQRKWQPRQWFIRYLDNPRGARYELRAQAVVCRGLSLIPNTGGSLGPCLSPSKPPRALSGPPPKQALSKRIRMQQLFP